MSGAGSLRREGEIQPYEQTANYRKRKVADRFTAEMLKSYCAALGIELFNANSYGGQCLLSHTIESYADRADHVRCRSQIPLVSLVPVVPLPEKWGPHSLGNRKIDENCPLHSKPLNRGR